MSDCQRNITPSAINDKKADAPTEPVSAGTASLFVSRPALRPDNRRTRGSANRRDRVAVLRPGLLVGALRRRTVLAVADRRHARGGNALRLQVVGGGVGAAVAERQVVFFGPALIAVAGD